MAEQKVKRVLPKGVSPKNFQAALGEWRKAIGEEWVLHKAEQVAPYSVNMLPIGDVMPSAVLRPDGVEDVQKILKVANRYKIPLWTVSTGKNFGYGTACAVQEGNVILDLGHRMNRILEVNADLAYALVEPGVTYMQLLEYLKKNKLPFWIDCISGPPTAGPHGNICDRGVGYTPYGEHFLMQCGMEVVLADGRVLRTGTGTLPNSKTWQVFKWGFGPYLDGIFTQSNFGIVTKVGFWLMPEPPAYRPFFATFPDEEDITAIVDLIRPLKLAMIVPNAATIANDLWAICALETYPYERAGGKTPLPDDLRRELRAKYNLGAWNIAGGLYGLPEHVQVNLKVVEAFLGKSPKVKFIDPETVKNHPYWSYRAGTMQGIPTFHELGLYNWRGGSGNQWCSPICPMVGEDAVTQMKIVKPILAKYGFDYSAEFILGWRDMHHIITVLYNRTQTDERKKAFSCFKEMIDANSDAGYLPYRTNIGFMEYTMNKLPVFKTVCKDLKKALDPNGILSPGKSGIRL